MSSLPDPHLDRLYAALGDHLAGGRPDGLFGARPGGPGSVPDLGDLGAPEWQLDLLPFPPTGAQQDALHRLGYTLAAETTGRRVYAAPGAPDVVLLSHDLGASHAQAVLWTYLRGATGEALGRYRQVYLAAGREAADLALLPEAEAAHLARTGFGPLEGAAALLAPLGLSWMFAAGWALDLHRHTVSGLTPSRPHEDVDIILPRAAQLDVGAALEEAGYRVSGVREGSYFPWRELLEAPDYQLHAHREGGEMLDLMLSDLGGDTWRYRRDPGVTLPLARARRVSARGLPYLAPEAALLFKANLGRGGVRPKDERDFLGALPTLDAGARAWLAAQIGPEHPWSARLAG